MTKAELVKKVAADAALTQKQAAAAVDSAIGAVVDAVAAMLNKDNAPAQKTDAAPQPQIMPEATAPNADPAKPETKS